MNGLQQATAALTTANYRSPKTVLGFFAILVGILCTGATVVIGVIASVPELHALVVPILVFSAMLIVVVLVGVFITAWKDPTILMLGQVTGEVYIENRKLTLGDSSAGEYTELIFSPKAISAGIGEEPVSTSDDSEGEE